MEDIMNSETIRRRDNGTIDLDFYRARALAERTALLTTTGKHIGRALPPAFAVFVIVLALSVMPAAEPINRTAAMSVPITMVR
jgi:hypothetical protein